ncbi:MAG: hypothetical protein IJN65_05715 [Clostridia bacterium]|nr:hypothetical protein [Clostridia bacterium]
MDRETFEKLTSAAQNRVANQQKKESAYLNGQNSKTEKNTPPVTVSGGENTSKNNDFTPKSRSGEILNLLNLKNISLDSERALIMGVLLLLAHENADEWLILALIYVML